MNNIESYISYLYKKMNIVSHELLNVGSISGFLGIDVVYWEYESSIASFGNKHKVFINNNLTWRRQWQDFGHEMSHYFLDDTCSDALSHLYVDYRESKAEYFSYHFCVPTFMLNQLDDISIYNVMNLFNVEFEFAIKRLEMYKNNLINNKGVIYLEKS